MEKLYLAIRFSYNAPTPFGYAYVSSSKSYIENVRDIDNVEEAVALMKRFFARKDFNAKEVVLSYSTLSAQERMHDVSRICEVYNGYDLYIYEGTGAYTNKYADKMGKKDFKEFYLNCANCALDFKSQAEQKEREEQEA